MSRRSTPRFALACTRICRDLGGEALRVDGVADHVHIVTTLPRTLSQRGYGAFSVSPSQLDAVLQYLEMQEEHHRTRTFQEEYRELLRRHGIEFDEQFVWD